MTTIEAIKSAINESIDHAQMKVEASKLQASLGRANLEDKLEDKRKATVRAATNLSTHLEVIGVTASDLKNNIDTEIENLQVQVALGKMEGKESIEKAKDEVTKYAEKFESVIEEVENIKTDKVEGVKEKLTDYMIKVSDLKASIEAKVDSYKS